MATTERNAQGVGLAAIDRAIGQAMSAVARGGDDEALVAHLNSIRETRAAFAELIDAAEAHNEASDELAASYGPDADRALREKIEARARLAAALARVQGGAA